MVVKKAEKKVVLRAVGKVELLVGSLAVLRVEKKVEQLAWMLVEMMAAVEKMVF